MKASREVSFVIFWRETLADDSDLTSTQKLVALVLSLYMSAAGGRAFPAATTTLPKKCSLSEKAVRNALKELVAAGWLKREHRKGKVSPYQATVPALRLEAIIDEQDELPSHEQLTLGSKSSLEWVRSLVPDGEHDPGTTYRTPRSEVPDTPVPGATEVDQEGDQEVAAAAIKKIREHLGLEATG